MSDVDYSYRLIGLVAGEVSGDTLGAGLIQALKKRYPNAEFVGIGGEQMIAEGMQSLFLIDRLSVMGLVEVLGRLKELLSIRKFLKNYFVKCKPDVFIGIDAPDFTLPLEGYLHEHGIKTMHYVSPSVWAWRSGRIKGIKKNVDHMLTLLPFEAEIYKNYGVPVTFVGHRLAHEIPVEIDRAAAREKLMLDQNARWLAVLPGSRKNEVKQLGPILLEVIKRLHQKDAALKFVIPAVSHERLEQLQLLMNKQLSDGEIASVQLVLGQSRVVLAAADAAVVASGTVTLEAMLLKCPLVAVYRWGALTHAIVSRLLTVKYVTLPNLLADELLVPELLQNDAEPGMITEAVWEHLNNEVLRSHVIQRFIQLHENLRCDSDSIAAQAVCELITDKG